MESNFSAKESIILKFWEDNNIFQKSIDKKSPKGDYVFYDGPPFATGLPHYGHLVVSAMKDPILRYKKMNGYHVEDRWGWDCHGLPIENIVEKDLGFKTKKEIEEYGIDKFNEACRNKVLEYASEWEKTIPRFGRWSEMRNAYKTMDLDYMESVWWVFKELWDKDLIYQDYKSMHVCPRCETTLSQQEVSEGYQDIKDLSVVAKFELADEPGTFVLAWTTTPWTLPGNVALALGPEIKYVKVESEGVNYILAKELVEKVYDGKEYEIKGEIKVKDLVGKKYRPLFDDYQNSEIENKENFYTIVAEDFVTTDEGTGVVHVAPAFGSDDMEAAKKNNLPFIQHVNMDGTIKSDIKELAGLNVKPIDDHQSTDVAVIKSLTGKGLLFSKEKYEHSYPHCWRCDTPLINYATSSWFIHVTKIKDRLLKEAKHINWSPQHIKAGRFGKWLEGARDWSISRQRFWASVMPIWVCQDCDAKKVYGSIQDLQKDSGQEITDLHKHVLDKIKVPCRCGGQMNRVPDVLDTWFDSGSMPYAQMHYPFENKDKFDDNFPAEFIAEAVDQTRAWFYYLHVIGGALKKSNAFKNVMVNGIVLAEDGKKMSKKLKNYPDPNNVFDQYGADALRMYLISSPVIEAENINFSEKEVKESLQKNVMLLGNILSFYQIYQNGQSQTANHKRQMANGQSPNILDRWIIAKLNVLTKDMTDKMDHYQLVKPARSITEFINELSTWYVRRSRERFRDGDEAGVQTLGYVLQEFSKLIAPFMPFISEMIYQEVGGDKESVHLADWPDDTKTSSSDARVLEEMSLARKIVERALAARYEAGIKIRQPLQSYTTNLAKKLDKEIIDIILDELNIKEIFFGDEEKLDTQISDQLKKEGIARELIRQINNFRKELNLSIDDQVVLHQTGFDDLMPEFGDDIKKASYLSDIKSSVGQNAKEVEGGTLSLEKK